MKCFASLGLRPLAVVSSNETHLGAIMAGGVWGLIQQLAQMDTDFCHFSLCLRNIWLGHASFISQSKVVPPAWLQLLGLEWSWLPRGRHAQRIV